MPTVLRRGPYSFRFYSSDGVEPPHIHVERDNNEAKFWLDPVRLQHSGRFRRAEINRIEALIRENREYLIGAWNEHFSG